MKDKLNTDPIETIVTEVNDLVHGLKTPLHHINLITTAILNGDSGKYDEEIKKDVADIKDRVDNAYLDIDKALKRISSIKDRSLLKLELKDISNSIKKAIMKLRPIAEAKGHEIIDNIPDKLSTVKIDENKIESVFTNLLTNAIKYTPENGMILIDGLINYDNIQIVVADNGPGIPSHSQDIIFEKFSPRLERSYDKSSSGIGLYIAHKNIELHNGKLRVISPLDKNKYNNINLDNKRIGTAFVVTIPTLKGSE